jgi:hypothetical protein
LEKLSTDGAEILMDEAVSCARTEAEFMNIQFGILLRFLGIILGIFRLEVPVLIS